MPARPSVLLTHQQSQAQHDRELLGYNETIFTPSTTVRQHLDPDALPRPDYFESLGELHTWYELRFGDAADDHLELASRHKSAPRHSSRRHSEAEASSPLSSSSGLQTRRPTLAVCHDFQGGYNERPDARGFSFEHFHLVDTFIYFSHKRVTIPPTGWIHAARRAGTKMLGTLIFEWKESIPDLAQLLRGPGRKSAGLRGPITFSPQYANELIELALDREFAGYLINVEVSLDLGFACSGERWPAWIGEQARHAEMSKNAERLRAWVCYLRDEGRKRFAEAGRPPHEWEIMWYDSVVYPQGQLAWQDALTPNNVDYFQAADTFFSNYTWACPPQPLPPGKFVAPDDQDPQALQLKGYGLTGRSDGGFHPALLLSAAMVDSLGAYARQAVHIGIDVFGRNCWGGMETWKSLDMIGPHRFTQSKLSDPSTADLANMGEELGLSVALFAPGWTWEHSEPEISMRSWQQWWQEDRTFWLGQQQPNRPHTSMPLQRYFAHSLHDKVRLYRRSISNPQGFYTCFAMGSGKRWTVAGRQVCNWDKLSMTKDAKLVGWTDMGTWMPKPDFLFASLAEEAHANKLSDVNRWWLDEETVFDGNVALGLELRANDGVIQIPLCSFATPAQALRNCTWTFKIAFKHEALFNGHISPLITCDVGKLDYAKFDFDNVNDGWKVGSVSVRTDRHWPSETLHSPVLLALGVRILNTHTPTPIWIGAVSFMPDDPQLRSQSHAIEVIPGPTRCHSDGAPLLSVSLVWPKFGSISPFYNVWLQIPDDSSSRVWLGTSTREATTEEFSIVGLDTAKLFPRAKELQLVATPVALTGAGQAAATLVF